MENRVLIAFVLSLLVFVVWGYFYSLVQGPPPEKMPVPTEQAQKTPSAEAPALPPGLPGGEEAIPLPGSAPAEPAEPSFPGTETLVKVANGGVNLVFSSRGAVLREVRILKYHDEEGQTINLVNHEGTGPWPLAIESSHAGITQILQNAFYEPSVDSLVLSETNPTGKLTFRLNHESGLQVERVFTFHYNRYLVDVQTQITAQPFAAENLQYTVFWGPGLGGAVSSQMDYIVFSGPTTFVNNERVEDPLDELDQPARHRGEIEWTALQNKYFAAALIPERGIKAAIVKKENEQPYVGLELESVQSSASVSHQLYVGTKELQRLEKLGHKLVRLMDYGWMGNKFAFLVKPLLKTLQFFYNITHNYGWSIIILTILIKILFFPLTHKSFKSMRGMQKIQPYVKVIQERHKDDRQKMNEEMLELYKKHKVNPLGGCLPMLLQIPVFIALYHALFFSIELRGAPFLGWITDLSVADPYYVTPVLMGATMFLQQRMTPSVGDPMQQKIMMMLPIFFTFLFISFPSGLVIYWTMNNLLTIAQQFYIYRIAKD